MTAKLNWNHVFIKINSVLSQLLFNSANGITAPTITWSD